MIQKTDAEGFTRLLWLGNNTTNEQHDSNQIGRGVFVIALLNHPRRPHEHVRWDCQADLLRCFQVDDEIELHRLFNG